jgi:hypothetical protein
VPAAGARAYVSRAGRRSERIRRTTGGFCFTGWNPAAPTLVPAPILLPGAHATAGWWAAALAGGAWSYAWALAAWSRYRLPALPASAVLLLVCLAVLHG